MTLMQLQITRAWVCHNLLLSLRLVNGDTVRKAIRRSTHLEDSKRAESNCGCMVGSLEYPTLGNNCLILRQNGEHAGAGV